MLEKLVKVIKLDISNKRVFVMSDIHGNYDLVDKLLTKHNFNENDYLFILGDLCRKGNDQLKTLRYIINLNKQPNVYVTMGNCDEADYLEFEEEYVDYFLNSITKNSLIKDMLDIYYQGKELPIFNKEQAIEIQKELKCFFNEELSFLENLPHVIETEKYLFTHAGVKEGYNLDIDDYTKYIRGRDFYYNGNPTNKVVVVGHMPTTIFKRNYYNNNVLFTDDNIIMIDGGMTVEKGGQINLLCIDNNNPYMLDSIDHLEQRKIIEDQISYTFSKGTCWPNYKIKVLEVGKYFSICLLPETLEVTLIKNEYINESKTETIDDAPGMFLNVKKGDIVSIIDKKQGYTLVKKDGILGWVKNNKIEGVI